MSRKTHNSAEGRQLCGDIAAWWVLAVLGGGLLALKGALGGGP